MHQATNYNIELVNLIATLQELYKLFAAGKLDPNQQKKTGQSGDNKAAAIKWGPEQLEFEAHMRMLDSAVNFFVSQDANGR